MAYFAQASIVDETKAIPLKNPGSLGGECNADIPTEVQK
jgi:hypothetical protein